MRIFKIAAREGTVFSIGDIVDIRSTGDGSVTAAPHSHLKNIFPVSLPRGIFRCKIIEVDNPDFYVDNVIKYVGQTVDGMKIKFTDKDKATKSEGSHNPSSIGAGRNRKQANANLNQEDDLPFISDVVCAWCNDHIGKIKSNTRGVSHGICKSCFEKVTSEMNDNPNSDV
jgi:hypothetical protein